MYERPGSEESSTNYEREVPLRLGACVRRYIRLGVHANASFHAPDDVGGRLPFFGFRLSFLPGGESAGKNTTRPSFYSCIRDAVLHTPTTTMRLPNVGIRIVLWVKQACRNAPRQTRHVSTSTSTSAPTAPSTAKPCRTCIRWTPDEDDMLIKLRGKSVPYKQIHLPGRSITSMILRLQRLAKGARGAYVAAEARKVLPIRGSSKSWSETDKGELIRLMDTGLSKKQAVTMLDCSMTAASLYLQSRRGSASHSGHKQSSDSSIRWLYTAEEDALLAELKSEGFTWPEIARRMPDRSLGSLHHQWHRMKREDIGNHPTDIVSPRVGYFDDLERIQLLDLYQQGLAPRAIARRLGRTLYSVSKAIRLHDLGQRPAESTDAWHSRLAIMLKNLRLKARQGSPSRSWRAYSAADVQSIRDMIQDGTPLRYIGRYLSRSSDNVFHKVSRLGLRQAPWSRTEKEKLYEYCQQGLAPPEIAVKLGRSEHSVRGNLNLMPLEQAVTAQHDDGQLISNTTGKSVSNKGGDSADKP